MANHAQAKKRIRQIGRRTAANSIRRTRIRTFVRKVEEAIKPFAIKELNELSLFLKALKKHNTLNQLLDFKD